MASTIWENEKESFDKIVETIKSKGKKSDYRTGHMLQAGNLRNSQRVQQRADIYSFNNDNGANVILMENNQIIEITYIYNNQNYDQLSITYDKTSKIFAYYLHSTPLGHDLLAIASRDKSEFPEYGDKYGRFDRVGELSDGEKGPTIRENIEKTLMKTPKFQKVGPTILAGFDQILSIDTDRKIIPLTAEELEIGKLKMELEKARTEIIQSQKTITRLDGDNKELEKNNSELSTSLQASEAENKELKIENKNLRTALERTQAMLSKALQFAKTVKESVFGKVFFRTPLKELNIAEKSLSNGQDDENLDER